MKLFHYIIFLSLLWSEVNSARILCVFPMPSFSHQSVFRAYTQALAREGHEIVMMTTNPTLPKDRPKDNITEIDIGSAAYSHFGKILTSVRNKGLTKLGFIYDMEAYTDVEGVSLFSTVCAEQFKLPQVKQIIDDKNQHFDLIIMESIIEYPLILSKIFKAPVIYFSSFYGTIENYETMGAVGRHPLLFPQTHRSIFGGVSLWDKLKEVYWDWKLIDFQRQVKENSNSLLKAQFGPDTPTIDELRQNVDLLFLNINPMFDNNRPVPPNVVYLGSLHLTPAQPLPEDLKSLLDKSKNGVVYVSFGTIIRPSEMSQDLLNTFFKAFAALPYDVLWKFDAENLKNKPDNVIIRKWVPQRDMLMHPKIKAFVTQGGLQSMDEAIDAGVPIVGIPMVADQWYNLHQSSKMGISIKLDALSLNSKVLSEAIMEVVENDSYKKNIKKLRSLKRDQPEKPLERAVWWTEYVLRHGGAKHLRSASANVSWSEYFMLDVLIKTAIIILFAGLVLIGLLVYLIRLSSKLLKLKEKQS